MAYCMDTTMLDLSVGKKTIVEGYVSYRDAMEAKRSLLKPVAHSIMTLP